MASKRGCDEESGASGCSDGSETKEGQPAGSEGSADVGHIRKRLRISTELSDAEVAARMEEIMRQRVDEAVNKALAAARCMAVPPALQETFTPNDPIHGLMHLPAIVRTVVDTLLFQRMRQIKQLGMCSLLYPGAVHNRFFHSIGTAFLAHELIKGLRQRTPELAITDRDALCATLAALCHDLGHPCYSHMFEDFVHGIGSEKRKAALEAALARGDSAPTPDEEADIQRYEQWTHEAASVMLLRRLFEQLREPLEKAGLAVDEEGDDFRCIEELIDPPKKRLEALLEAKQLRSGWSEVIKGRPVQKAWLYEIVSNWRSGIDVDKFDYFRRDAYYLGIQRQFDHHRYMKSVRVIEDPEGVPTISAPEKHTDSLRNMLELRKTLHRSAYQHKTAKKLEVHMIDILKLMDKHVRVTGEGGRKLSMSEAAVLLDPVAYPKLTDTFAEARLMDHEDPALKTASDEFEKRILLRQLMRLVGEWELPRLDEAAPFSLPGKEAVLSGVHAQYLAHGKDLNPDVPLRVVPEEELRTQVAALHYGMGEKDPITRIVFHSTKGQGESPPLPGDGFANPLRQKLFFFWNPAEVSDDLTLRRLTLAFTRWAEQQVQRYGSGDAAPAPQVKKEEALAPSPEPTPAQAAQPVAAKPAPRPPRRALRIQASCPINMADPLLLP